MDKLKQPKNSDLAVKADSEVEPRPSRRREQQGLCGEIYNQAYPHCWDVLGVQLEEIHQRGGREGKILALATEEGNKVGLNTPMRAAGGRRPLKSHCPSTRR